MPSFFHDGDALRGFDSANEYGSAVSGFAAGEVDAPVYAVGAIDIKAGRFAKHGAVSWGGAGIAVRGRFCLVVGFGFDNDAANAVCQKSSAYQLPGDNRGIL